MSSLNVIMLVYFIIGFILALLWWNEFNENGYEDEEATVDVFGEMISLLQTFFFWPIKLLKELIDSFMK